jgi:hypothetical protein
MDVRLSLSQLSAEVAGLVVSKITQASETLEVHFTNRSTLVIQPTSEGVSAILKTGRGDKISSGGPEPTARQQDYLDFIKKFMHRYGIAPAETDIQQHFLVSAPSVNQMVRTLERRGFIVRDRDWSGQTVPRSIRVLWEG